MNYLNNSKDRNFMLAQNNFICLYFLNVVLFPEPKVRIFEYNKYFVTSLVNKRLKGLELFYTYTFTIIHTQIKI